MDMIVALILLNVLGTLFNSIYGIQACRKKVYKSSEDLRKGMVILHFSVALFNVSIVGLLINIL